VPPSWERESTNKLTEAINATELKAPSPIIASLAREFVGTALLADIRCADALAGNGVTVAA
jgi:hypothetical protein